MSQNRWTEKSEANGNRKKGLTRYSALKLVINIEQHPVPSSDDHSVNSAVV